MQLKKYIKFTCLKKEEKRRSFQQGQVDETIRSSASCLSEITLMAAAFIFPQVISQFSNKYGLNGPHHTLSFNNIYCFSSIFLFFFSFFFIS